MRNPPGSDLHIALSFITRGNVIFGLLGFFVPRPPLGLMEMADDIFRRTFGNFEANDIKIIHFDQPQPVLQPKTPARGRVRKSALLGHHPDFGQLSLDRPWWPNRWLKWNVWGLHAFVSSPPSLWLPKKSGLVTKQPRGCPRKCRVLSTFFTVLPINACKKRQDQPKWLNGLTTRRFFRHTPSGEGFVKIF